jgi:hypothetical protein
VAEYGLRRRAFRFLHSREIRNTDHADTHARPDSPAISVNRGTWTYGAFRHGIYIELELRLRIHQGPCSALRAYAFGRRGRGRFADYRTVGLLRFESQSDGNVCVAGELSSASVAVDALQEGHRLQANGHSGAAVVSFVTAIEILLKATVLKPVVHGLIHSDGLADIVVEQAPGQSGFDRYAKLLKRLFSELVGLDIARITREGAQQTLLEECTIQQTLRNQIIHQGMPSRGSHVARQLPDV